ncbi:hypothetical protein KI387_038363, partial [Taxus chinensis]
LYPSIEARKRPEANINCKYFSTLENIEGCFPCLHLWEKYEIERFSRGSTSPK